MATNIIDYAYSEASKRSDGFAEAYAEEYASMGAAIEQGKFNGIFSSSGSGIRIRMMSKGNLYSMSTNLIDKQSVKSMVSRARGLPGRKVGMSDEPAVKGKDIVKGKKEPDIDGIKDAILKIDNYLQDKRVKYRSVYINFSYTKSAFMNDCGSSIEAHMPIINVYANFIIAGKKGTRSRFMQLGGVGGLEALSMNTLERRLEDEISGLYEVAQNGKNLGAQELKSIKNVVISPEISGIAVHESIGHPNESDRVFGREAAQAGTSYINGGNLGLKVGSAAVTIIDEPQISGSNGYYKYDDEGVIGRKKTIIKKGIQNELLTNREYAAMLGTRSNGSARSSSYSFEPIVRMSNTYLQKGSATFDELVSEARNGIYVKSFNGWNIDDTRSFSMYQGNEAYIIRNGRIAEPVMNYKLETSTLKFWHAVALVGKDFNLYLATCGKGEPEQGVPVTNGGASALLKFNR
ncbi:MAG: TldD/PmbA family protein [Candidatus Marsarchaeota archaeon]|nr:TldD/PmbA family protein [Candidatus Marsarchaeota archaeon]